MTWRDKLDAQFGRGDFVGKTGDPFIDDKFFNPWAPGGAFDRSARDRDDDRRRDDEFDDD